MGLLSGKHFIPVFIWDFYQVNIAVYTCIHMGLASGKHCSLYQYSCGTSIGFCVFRGDFYVGFCFQKGCFVGFCVFRRAVLWYFVFSEGMFCSIFEPPNLQPQHVENPVSPAGVLQLQRWGQCVSYSIIPRLCVGAVLKLCMI